VVKLVTDEFSAELDSTFRKQLIDNFKIIEQALKDFDTKQTNFINSLSEINKTNSKAFSEVDNKLATQANILGGDLNVAIDNLNKQLTMRINRITLGTDDEAIELVVTEILKEKGVIN